MAKKKKTKKTTRRAAPPTVERRIMFFRINCGGDDGGQPLAYDPGPPLRRINGLPWSNTGRYQPNDDGTVTCAWVDRTQANQRMQLATVRRSALPLMEDGSGTLSSLGIPSTAGLAEITHLTFFPANILGAVFNFYGPRPTRLATYLKSKIPGTPADLTIEPLIKTDVSEELERLETLRLVDLRIRPSYSSTVEEADESLGAAFGATAEAVTDDLQEVQIVLRAGRKRGSDLGASIRRCVEWLVGRDDLQENASRFQVGGVDIESQRSTVIDLLNDKLVSSKRIIKQGGRSRALDNASAYNAIQEAYDELKDELEEAAALEVQQ